jgi:hypothetical protein
MNSIKLFNCIIAIALVPMSLFADSYTLDFQHPTGQGSAFADAVDITKPGSITDSSGRPIGFTYACGSGFDGNRATGAELENDGLQLLIGSECADLMLGMPFGFEVRQGSPIKITARFKDVVASSDGGDFGESFELLGVGVGPKNARKYDAFTHVKAFGNKGTPNFNAQVDSISSGAGATLKDLTISMVSANGHTFKGVFNEANGTGFIVDVLDNIGNPDSVGVVMFNRNGANQYSATLTSITYEALGAAYPDSNK